VIFIDAIGGGGSSQTGSARGFLNTPSGTWFAPSTLSWSMALAGVMCWR
jgi:hypothetical protein